MKNYNCFEHQYKSDSEPCAECSQFTPAKVDDNFIEKIYEVFANWYQDDGSYDTFLKSEAMKAIDDYYVSIKPSNKEEDMKEALIQIEQFSDCGSNHVAIVRMKEIASKALSTHI